MVVLIINNSKRISGTATNFIVKLSPSITINKATLLYANIANAANNTQPFYLITVEGLQPNVRGADSSDVSASYVVPLLQAAETRNIFVENSIYSAQCCGCGQTLSQLHVRVFHPDGTEALSTQNLVLLLDIV
jgi:hypothetical protein